MKLSRAFLIPAILGIPVLAACSPGGQGTPKSVPEPVASVTPEVPTGDESSYDSAPGPRMPGTSDRSTSPSSPEIDPCLVGQWRLVDMSSYLITAMESAGVSVEYEFSSGQAIYLFSTDGTFLLQADQYVENWVIKQEGIPPVPISIGMDGFGSANYSASGGRVTFTNMSSSSLVFEVTVLGEAQSMDFWALDDRNAASDFLYECVGADTLHLTPPINDYAVFPIILERDR